MGWNQLALRCECGDARVRGPAFWSGGGHQSSVDLDGSSEEMRTTANTAFDAGNFSILVIAKNADLAQAAQRLLTIEPTGSTIDRITVGKPTGGSADLQIGCTGNNGNISDDDTFAGVYTTGTWRHVLFTWNNGNIGGAHPNAPISCYIDGVLTAPTVHAFGGGDGLIAVSRQIVFGANKAGANFWDGKIYQMAYWGNRILSAAAVTDIYNGGKPSGVDLNNARGNYSSAMAADLDFWYQFWKDPTNLMRNYATSPPSTPTWSHPNVAYPADFSSDFPG